MATWFGKAFRFVADTAVGLTDSSLSRVGLGKVIPDSAYSSTKSASAWSSVQTLGNKASNTILNSVVPGAGSITGALQTFNPTVKTITPAVSPLPTATSPAVLPLSTPGVSNSPDPEDYTDYYIIGGVMLVLVVFIIIFLKR